MPVIAGPPEQVAPLIQRMRAVCATLDTLEVQPHQYFAAGGVATWRVYLEVWNMGGRLSVEEEGVSDPYSPDFLDRLARIVEAWGRCK